MRPQWQSQGPPGAWQGVSQEPPPAPSDLSLVAHLGEGCTGPDKSSTAGTKLGALVQCCSGRSRAARGRGCVHVVARHVERSQGLGPHQHSFWVLLLPGRVALAGLSHGTCVSPRFSSPCSSPRGVGRHSVGRGLRLGELMSALCSCHASGGPTAGASPRDSRPWQPQNPHL